MKESVRVKGIRSEIESIKSRELGQMNAGEEKGDCGNPYVICVVGLRAHKTKKLYFRVRAI